MADRNKFNKRVADIAKRAELMRNLCIDSQLDPLTNTPLTSPEMMLESLDAAIQEQPMFESVTIDHAREIVTGAQSSIRDYEATYGELPRDEVLASAHRTMESMLTLDGQKRDGSTGEMMLESIGQSMTTSDGVELRAKMIGLILPTILATATTDAVTMMPAGHDEVELFEIRRLAGTSFGDFAKGTEIDHNTVGQYSSMRQRYALVDGQQPDGTLAEHTFTSKTDLENTDFEIPFNKGSVSVFINHQRVCRDLDTNGNGYMNGVYDGTVINCQIDYTKGTITVTPTTTLPAGVKLHAEFEVDIESRPDLIPSIDHDMRSAKIRPAQNAIAADATIQAMFTMQREFGTDLKSMQMSHMRNYLAAEKSQRHLMDIQFATTTEDTFNIYVPLGEDWRLHREQLNEVFLNISRKILNKTHVVGMTGMFAGITASTVLKSLGAPYFVAPDNYRQLNHIHYCGKLFGTWKVFECPVILDENEIICYGRGANHSEAGYVAGDAIPATMYNHPIGTNLRAQNTLYELAYGEVHPFEGSDFFHRLWITNEAPEEAVEA